MFSHIFLHFSPPRAGAKFLPAKFSAGSRRPARSARSPARRISSQNVTSAHNYGIVKAGDGGNGGRGLDGKGGSDKTDGSAPISGTRAGAGGKAGAAGVAYLNNSENVNALPGEAGLYGNLAWGGLNLHKYETKYTSTSTVSKKLCDYSEGVWLVDKEILLQDIFWHAYVSDGEATTSKSTSKVIVHPYGEDNAEYGLSYIKMNIHNDLGIHSYKINFDMNNGAYCIIYWYGSIDVKVNSGNMFPNNFTFSRYAYNNITQANINKWE